MSRMRKYVGRVFSQSKQEQRKETVDIDSPHTSVITTLIDSSLSASITKKTEKYLTQTICSRNFSSSRELVEELTILCYKNVDRSTVPVMWKESIIIPMLKKDNVWKVIEGITLLNINMKLFIKVLEFVLFQTPYIK